LASSEVDHDSDPRSGLDVVRRVAHSWGILPLADGSRVVWCTIQPATDLDASATGFPEPAD
jgi:hypothetical protein